MKSVDLELCYMTATEAIDRFKSKDLSPVELIDQLIARIESTNPSLNAFTYTFLIERVIRQPKLKIYLQEIKKSGHWKESRSSLKTTMTLRAKLRPTAHECLNITFPRNLLQRFKDYWVQEQFC